MHLGPIVLAARSTPRALKGTALAVGVLVGLSGGLACAAVIMAAEVETAFDRVTQATDAFDALVFVENPVDSPASDLRRAGIGNIADARDLTIIDVAAVTAGGHPRALGPKPDEPCYTGAGDVATTVRTDGWRGRSPQMALAAGRFPRADAPEAVLPTITADRLGLAVGDHIEFTGGCGDGETPFAAPIDVRISGLGTSLFDGPEIGANLGLEVLLISPRLAHEVLTAGAQAQTGALVWLDHGARPSDLVLRPGDSVLFDVIATQAAVRADLRPDATALRVFSVIVALSALLILGPVLGRLVRAATASTTTLRALGMDRRGLLMIGLVRGAAVGLVVAVVTAGATAAFATRLPLGAAQQFATAIPFSPGWASTLAGALAVAGAVITIMGTTSWATGRRGAVGEPRRPPGRLRRSASVLALRPAWGTGVRFALEPGSADDPTSTRSGLATAAVAVAVIVAVITFSSSLDQLRNTPRLYGVNWDALTFPATIEPLATRLEHDPAVERLSRGTFFPPQFAALGDPAREVWLMSFEAGPGRVTPSVISGRAPEGDREVLLAPALSRSIGAGIGDEVRLHLPTAESLLAQRLGLPRDGPDEQLTVLEVVGTGVLPVGDGRVGIGASMTFSGLRAAAPPTDSPGLRQIVASAPPARLTELLQANVDPTLTAGDVAAMSDAEVLAHLLPPIAADVVVFDAGGPARAAQRAIAASGGTLTTKDFAQRPTPERVIQLDLSQPGRIPDTFSGLMTVVAVAVVTLLVAVGGHQRRRDLAILRTLGFRNREVREALLAQGITTVAAAAVLVPVGVALGRLAWLAYARSLGVVPVVRVPPLDIVINLAALLTVALVAGMIAAWLHLRRPLAALLRPSE